MAFKETWSAVLEKPFQTLRQVFCQSFLSFLTLFLVFVVDFSFSFSSSSVFFYFLFTRFFCKTTKEEQGFLSEVCEQDVDQEWVLKVWKQCL